MPVLSLSMPGNGWLFAGVGFENVLVHYHQTQLEKSNFKLIFAHPLQIAEDLRGGGLVVGCVRCYGRYYFIHCQGFSGFLMNHPALSSRYTE